jgi:hypothetical protein
MNKILKYTLFLFLLVGLISCKEDETTTIYIVPYAEQEPIDNALIIDFLSTNYFNEEEFLNPIVGFDFNIDFSSDEVVDVATGQYTRTSLINYVNTEINNFTIETKTINIGDVDHILYILKVIQGQGAEKPKFCDNAFLSYEGLTLDSTIFDNALNPVDLDLSSTIKGFSESVSEFNIADNTESNGDGTFTYENYGVGAVFMPSALGYYQSGVSGISPYSPLIFKLKVYGKDELDHDNDGIPSYLEDLNGNNSLLDEDTDLDNIPNYQDSNDDGDPIETINEDLNGDGDYSNDDTDSDGIPNYLDPDN